MQRRYFDRSPYGSRIVQHSGFALDCIPKIEETFDLVFIDTVMPRMNGYETFEQILVVNPQVRAIIMSGYSSDTPTENVETTKIAGFIQKPFDRTELQRKMAAATTPEA